MIRYEHLDEAIHLAERQRRHNLCIAEERLAELQLERSLKRDKLVSGYHQQNTETLVATGLSEEERREKLNRSKRLHELQLADFDKLSTELEGECHIISKDTKNDQILEKLQLKVCKK